MRLTIETKMKVTEAQAIVIGHMTYAASKLWNECNYERKNYKELGFENIPNWYFQKAAHKESLWFKSLPSQSAQEVCKILDQAWKSFFCLKKKHPEMNPKPPRFKQENMPVTYMQNGIVHHEGSGRIRLTISKTLKKHLLKSFGLCDNFLFLENPVFRDAKNIRQIRIYPPKDQKIRLLVVYEVEDRKALEDNGHYLSIDMGLHNLMTCLDSEDGTTFIAGRKYLSLCYHFEKEIDRVQSQWAKTQATAGIRYPKPSRHVLRLYEKKRNILKDYLHKVTRYIVRYCTDHDIHTVILGDITGIRDENDLGKKTNRKLHALPYLKIRGMLEYKLSLEGITLVIQNEAYSSQCSPMAPEVSRLYARKSNRIQRGLYRDGEKIWNADCVGAYNILRKFLARRQGILIPLLEPEKIRNPYIARIPV